MSTSTTIRIPSPLRVYTAEQATVKVDGNTVGEVLEALERVHPKVANHLRDDDGVLRRFINIYLGDEDIRHLAGEATAVNGQDLSLVPSLAGGTGCDDVPKCR